MDSSSAAQAALRIGALRSEQPSADVAAAALQELARAFPCDGASIVLMDPEPSVLTEFGYDADVSEAFARVFPQTPWMGNVHSRPLPPSISLEPEDAFRQGWFFQNYIRDSGIRDGMGALLKSGDRVLGMVNMSCTRDAYGEEECATFAVLVDAMAPLVDVRGALLDDAGQPHAPAAVLHDGTAMELPGRPTPAFVTDAEFLEVTQRFDHEAGSRMAFLWPTPTAWYRTVLETAHIPNLGGRNIVVRAQSVAAPHGLSVREIEVLTCLALGLSNDAVARIFTVSSRTVHGHVENILRKTGVKSRGEAAALAWREGLVCPRPAICDPRQLQPIEHTGR